MACHWPRQIAANARDLYLAVAFGLLGDTFFPPQYPLRREPDRHTLHVDP